MSGSDLQYLEELVAEMDLMEQPADLSDNASDDTSSMAIQTDQPSALPQIRIHQQGQDPEIEYNTSHRGQQNHSHSSGSGRTQANSIHPYLTFHNLLEVPPNALQILKDIEADFPDLGYRKGDRVERDPTSFFCPLRFVSRYVDLYVGKANTPIVRPYFKQEAFLSAQKWDFFYLYNAADQSGKPFLLLLTSQFRHFLQTINDEQGINLAIPAGDQSAKFNISFAQLQGENSPRPRYLGQATDPYAFGALIQNMPSPHPEDNANKLAGLDHKLFQDIWKAMKASIEEQPRKSSKSSHKQVMRAAMHKGWGHTTKRVQRYLGLRKKRSDTEDFTVSTGQKTQMTELNPDALAPFWPEDFVVFICVDCETYEKNQNIVTEVGFGILDTKDLASLPPGEDGKNWFKKIQGRHLRIKERTYMVNTEYVKGCPDYFNFGESEFVSLSQVRRVIEEILSQTTFPYRDRRPVILVGHDVQHDIVHLSKVGIDVDKMWNILEIVDNQGLQQFMRKMMNGQKLERILAEFELPYSHLHNAGNDAVYTLQSLVVLAIRQRQASLQRILVKEPDSADPSLLDEGWSSGGEGCDGGAPPSRNQLSQEEIIRLLQNRQRPQGLTDQDGDEHDNVLI